MSSDWKVLLISELADQGKKSTSSGPFGSNLVSRDYTESGVPVIRGGNMSSGRWVGGDFAWVSEEKADELSANLAFPGEIVFTQRGTLGQVCLIPDGQYDKYVLSQSQMKLRVNPSICDSLFMLYQFKSPEQQAYIDMNSIRVGVPHTNLGILRDTPCQVPPLSTQKAIAHILGTLDEKIELNRKTNATLEAMAKALFKSWFVDFDPVRAKAEGRPTGLPAEISDLFPDSFEDSELGEIPSGWKISNLGSLIKQCGEPIQASSATRELPYVPIDCISSKSLSLREYKSGAEANTSLVLFREGDLLFGAMRPYFHKVCIAPFDGTTRTTCFALRPFADSHYAFVAMLLSAASTIEYATLHSTGSTIPYIKWSNSLENMLLIQPPNPILDCFNNTALPILRKLSISLLTERPIAAFRDTLLPKLISGEIRIPDAEKMLEEVGI
jgi:type I restriction enzyme, S subunit